MRRYGLRDDQWDRIKPLLLGQQGWLGVMAADNRRFVQAVLYRYQAGIPWRDLPARWRFSRWAKSGVWQRVFEHFASDVNMP